MDMSLPIEGSQSRRPQQADPATDTYPLDRVRSCARAEVLAVTINHGVNRRLAELGILVGAKLRVLRSAPMGGPILIEVQGSTVALGRALAREVSVRVLA